MAIVEAFKCDICNYVYEKYDQEPIIMTIGEETYKDLCPRCRGRITSTISGLKDHTRINYTSYKGYNNKSEIVSREAFDNSDRR